MSLSVCLHGDLLGHVCVCVAVFNNKEYLVICANQLESKQHFATRGTEVKADAKCTGPQGFTVFKFLYKQPKVFT